MITRKMDKIVEVSNIRKDGIKALFLDNVPASRKTARIAHTVATVPLVDVLHELCLNGRESVEDMMISENEIIIRFGRFPGDWGGVIGTEETISGSKEELGVIADWLGEATHWITLVAMGACPKDDAELLKMLRMKRGELFAGAQ